MRERQNNSSELTKIRALILSQSTALEHLAHSIDDSFLKSLNLLRNLRGRLIVSGVGKSALIGRKLSATFSSTGTSSFFMHAADALHGDLGMITNEDLVMLLSKSGETAELKALVPLIKMRGNKLIGLVCTQSSYLSEQCDASIQLPLEQEADPHGLVPTTSATLQLVAGQALAIGLMQHRNFTAKDFAHSHPGGSLGKKLYLRVEDLIDPRRIPRVRLRSSLRQIIIEISTQRQGAAVVTDESNNVLGIITDGDLRRMLEAEQDLSQIDAEALMTKNPKCIDAGAMATEALLMMRQNQITQVVAIGSDGYLGLVHLHDLLKEGIV